MGLNILLVGATGAVGSRVATKLANLAAKTPAKTPKEGARDIANLYAMTRRQPMASVTCLPFSLLDEPLPSSSADNHKHGHPSKLDTFICTLGTTQKQAGSQTAFAKVDHELVIRCAQYAHALGATRAIVMSSVGAESKSNSFYLKTKGEMERSLRQIGYEQTHVLRPSLLLAQRDHLRPAELMGGYLSCALNPLLIGPLRRYRSISCDTVAAAICQLAIASTFNDDNSNTCKDAQLSFAIHEYDAITALARQHAERFQLN